MELLLNCGSVPYLHSQSYQEEDAKHEYHAAHDDLLCVGASFKRSYLTSGLVHPSIDLLIVEVEFMNDLTLCVYVMRRLSCVIYCLMAHLHYISQLSICIPQLINVVDVSVSNIVITF